jgi:hypothetical protein
MEAKNHIESHYNKETVVRAPKSTKDVQFKALNIEIDTWRDFRIKDEITVLGLMESYKGSGTFNLLRYKTSDGKYKTESIGRNAEQRNFIFKNEEIEKSIKNYQRMLTVFADEQKEIDRLEKDLAEKKFKTKESFIRSLTPIIPLEELEWRVMASRESNRQKGIKDEEVE